MNQLHDSKYFSTAGKKQASGYLAGSFPVMSSVVSRLRPLLLKPQALWVVYTIVTIVASLALIARGRHDGHNGYFYTSYNNYIIFKQSWLHLLSGKDLYAWYLAEQWDLYKYSPTFALFMAPLTYLPDWLGLCLWNFLNAATLLLAVRMLQIEDWKKQAILWFCLLELLTSLQNAQSNGLLAGLMIAAYVWLQRGKVHWATLLLVLATFIKVYGAVGFCLFFFYPQKARFVAWSVVWTVVLAALPLLVTPLHTLTAQYQSWVRMMGEDASTSYGVSVMGWMHSWFGAGAAFKKWVLLGGLALFGVQLMRWRLWGNDHYRMLMLASMLIWVIIFNHKAESPTFIIAVAGVAIWYWGHKTSSWRRIVLWTVFIGTCLSPTDLFPPFVKQQFFVPYAIKAVPCILVWALVFADIMRLGRNEHNANSSVLYQGH